MSKISEERDISYSIQNVVATVTTKVTEKIDLHLIARKISDVEYNPERFPGLILRIEDPRATALIFSTGKMVLTGLKKETHAEIAMKEILDRLKKIGLELPLPSVTIQNIVAKADLNMSIDINKAAIVMESVMYEPEVFPGLIYRMKDPKSVFLLFNPGKIVCLGTKNENQLKEAISQLKILIIELGLEKSRKNYEDVVFF